MISRALIGQELCLIRVQTIEVMWWWRNLFFSLYRVRFSKKLQRKWISKTVSVITVENNNFSWPVLLSIIEMPSKCSQLCSKTTHLWLVPLKFWTFWHHLELWSRKVQIMGNCRWFVNHLQQKLWFAGVPDALTFSLQASSLYIAPIEWAFL